jgi:hypothetical protein
MRVIAKAAPALTYNAGSVFRLPPRVSVPPVDVDRLQTRTDVRMPTNAGTVRINFCGG